MSKLLKFDALPLVWARTFLGTGDNLSLGGLDRAFLPVTPIVAVLSHMPPNNQIKGATPRLKGGQSLEGDME